MNDKIISWNNLKQYNTKRDEVVAQKIQNTIPAEDSYITYVIKDADGNKKLYGTNFKYNIVDTAITTASGTSIIDLKGGSVNITAATINSTVANIDILSLKNTSRKLNLYCGTNSLDYTQITDWILIADPIDSRSSGNAFLHGTFTANSAKDFCWFKIETNIANIKSVNVNLINYTLDTNTNTPIVDWNNQFIYIGIKGAINSKINFTCFF